MQAQRPVPRDLLFFLREEVFPHAPREALEEALHCSRVLLLTPEEPGRARGLYIVYSGSVEYRGAVYERGDYFLHDGRGEARPRDGEAVAIVVEERCGQALLHLPAEPCRLGDLVHRPPVTVAPETPVHEAVRLMHREGVSSVVVVDGEGRPLGIFTDTDLRRMVALGEPLDKPLAEAMTRDPYGLPPSVDCGSAAYRMMEWNVKHLLVVEDSRLLGVVTVRDIAYAEALGPLYVRRLVRSARGPGELREAYSRLLRVLRRFNRRLHPLAGGDPSLVAMASLALRSVVEKAAEMAALEEGVEPRGWAYLVMGSNARLEQAWPTDRDTALVYTSLTRGQAEALAGRVEDLLDEVGFPGCSHGYTARRLVYSIGGLASRLREAAGEPDRDENITLIGLFMDAVAAGGEAELAARARRLVAEALEATGSRAYARAALAAYRPRLGPLGRLPSRIDLKRDALAPIVFAVKALAAGEGLWEPVATAERLEALAARGVVPEDLAGEALEAYRVVLGLTAWATSIQGSREIEASRLSGLERSMLRSALRSIQRLVDRARSPA